MRVLFTINGPLFGLFWLCRLYCFVSVSFSMNGTAFTHYWSLNKLWFGLITESVRAVICKGQVCVYRSHSNHDNVHVCWHMRAVIFSYISDKEQRVVFVSYSISSSQLSD